MKNERDADNSSRCGSGSGFSDGLSLKTVIVNECVVLVPSWVSWIAMDSNHSWHGFRDKPLMDRMWWESKPCPNYMPDTHIYNGLNRETGLTSFESSIRPVSNWRMSLVQV